MTIPVTVPVTAPFKRSLKLLLVGLAALGIASGCSCERNKKETPPAPAPAVTPKPPAPPKPVPPPSPSAHKTLHETLEQSIQLPDSYPKDAPVYPNSRVSESGRERGMVSTIFSTEDSRADVMTFLKKNLADQGWQSVTSNEMPQGALVQAFKGSRKVSVLVSRLENEGRTLIAVTVDP